MYYMISLLICIIFSLLFFKLIKYILSYIGKDKKIIRSRSLSYFILLLSMLAPLLLILFGGISLAKYIQYHLFNPGMGYALIPKSSEILISVSSCILGLFTMAFFGSIVLGHYDLNLNNGKPGKKTEVNPSKSNKGYKNNITRASIICTVILTLCLVLYGWGIQNYAYVLGSTITVRTALSISQTEYDVSDINSINISTYLSDGSNSYELTIHFKDHLTITTGIYEDGIAYLIKTKNVPEILFDTPSARDAFRNTYSK